MAVLLRRACGLALQLGGSPTHVAFIMDGNRRFAEREHVDRAAGHSLGYRKMVDVIHWCLELGVKFVSVYAFSIDNFRRSPEEVSTLMHLAEEKFQELMQDNGLADREGVEVRILGDLELPPPSVQGAAARIMTATAKLKNKRAVLNICFSYTATQELQQAVDSIQPAAATGELHTSDITPTLLQQCLHTSDCPPVSLLIRTSGETRLSDFLLLQCSCAHLCFVDVLWPDLSYFHFLSCILQWQQHAPELQRLASAHSAAAARACTAGAEPPWGKGAAMQQQTTCGSCSCSTKLTCACSGRGDVGGWAYSRAHQPAEAGVCANGMAPVQPCSACSSSWGEGAELDAQGTSCSRACAWQCKSVHCGARTGSLQGSHNHDRTRSFLARKQQSFQEWLQRACSYS